MKINTEKRINIKNKEKYLVAVSGGVDSMVLVHKLMKFHSISIVHINHQTRGKENSREEELVENYALKNKIPFWCYKFFYSQKGNFHEEARNFRLNKYKELVEKNNFNGVILGQHLDDQIENIYMNPEKIGNKLMKFQSQINAIQIYRPLLGTYKSEIQEYANRNKIPFLTDSSNLELNYTRNKIREKLKKISKNQKEKQYNEELQKEKALNSIKEKFIQIKNNRTFLIKDLTNLEEISLEKIYLFLKIHKIDTNVSKEKLLFIYKKIKNGKNVKISIDKKNLLWISYEHIYITPNLEKKEFQEKKNMNSKQVKQKKENKEIQKLVVDSNLFNDLKFENKYPVLDRKIKTFENGDVYKIKNHTKKVARFFIDQKIPPVLRKKWPLIINENNEIIWIPTKKEIKLTKNLEEYHDEY